MAQGAESNSEAPAYRLGRYYHRWLQDRKMGYSMPRSKWANTGPDWQEIEAAEKAKPPYVDAIMLALGRPHRILSIRINNLKNSEGYKTLSAVASAFHNAVQKDGVRGVSAEAPVFEPPPGGQAPYLDIVFSGKAGTELSLDNILGWLEVLKTAAIPNLDFEFIKESVAADKALAGLKPEDKAEFDVYTDWTRTNNKSDIDGYNKRREGNVTGWTEEKPKPLRPDQNIIERIVASKDRGSIILAEDVLPEYRDKIVNLRRNDPSPRVRIGGGVFFEGDEKDQRIIRFRFGNPSKDKGLSGGPETHTINRLLNILKELGIHKDSRQHDGGVSR